MLFDSGKRFSDPGSELAGNLAQSVHDILSLGRLGLLLVEDITGIAGLRLQAQHVLASQACDGALQNRGAPGSLADFPRDFRSEPRSFRLTHQSQRLQDLLVPNQTEERRLLKLYQQPLAQRVVEHRIACLIIEIRQNDGVLAGQFRRAVEISVRRGEYGNNTDGSRNGLPGASAVGHFSQFPLQLGSRLPAACRLLFEAAVYDLPQSSRGN